MDLCRFWNLVFSPKDRTPPGPILRPIFELNFSLLWRETSDFCETPSARLRTFESYDSRCGCDKNSCNLCSGAVANIGWYLTVEFLFAADAIDPGEPLTLESLDTFNCWLRSAFAIGDVPTSDGSLICW